MIRGVIKHRYIKPCEGSIYQIGQGVIFKASNSRWISDKEDRHWADIGIHASDVIVELNCTHNELEMAQMLYPEIALFIEKGNIVARENS